MLKADIQPEVAFRRRIFDSKVLMASHETKIGKTVFRLFHP
jgi:hypothetical protein